MSFLQFFVWGAWLITIATYYFNNPAFVANNPNAGAQFGAIFGTLALSSLFMPAITGIIADKWMDAEKLYGILHILYGVMLFLVPSVPTADQLYYVIFGAMICYMPTISLSNSIAYTILKSEGYDVVKVFPPIRVWGTIGFIVAMWLTNLTGSKGQYQPVHHRRASAPLPGPFFVHAAEMPAAEKIAKEAGLMEQLPGLQAVRQLQDGAVLLFFHAARRRPAADQYVRRYFSRRFQEK
jgi:NHS family xanthosine MFS transporter